jgi:hypothetical protein
MDRRAQAYTLEGVAAGLVLVSALLFAFQAVSVTPAVTGAVNAESRAQLQTETSDTLHAAHSQGALERTVLNYNNSTETFAGADPSGNASATEVGYGLDDIPGEFGAMMNQTFEQRGFAFNVYVEYLDEDDPSQTNRRVVALRGEPTADTVSASVSVALYDSDRLPNGYTLAEVDATNDKSYFASDIDSGELFNVVTVEVVVW